MNIIGIDHGNAAMKTRSFCFPSGIVEYENEPYTKQNVLEYGGKYYICGTGRQPLLKDKTSTNRYFLLTLAALAKELNKRNIPSPSEVHIAAGLPLANYGRDLVPFKEYLQHEKHLRFRYEGKEYEIEICSVSLFPQAVAAVYLHMDMLRGEPSVIIADIGGWTVDLMRIDRGMTDASSCRSLEMGMIRCMDEIMEQVRRRTGLSVTAAQIETVLNGKPCSIDTRVKQIIEREGENYTRRLLSSISECGFDAGAMPIIFMGGGALLFKRHVSPSFALCHPIIIDDVCINAKGYEKLCEVITRDSEYER